MSNSSNLYTILGERYGKQTLTVNEAAVELGVGVDDINTAIENGDITAKQLGKKVLIPLTSLITFLSDEDLSNNIDCMSNTTVRSNETINIVEDDIDMATGSITYVKSASKWLYQIDLGKTDDGKRIRKSKSFVTEEEARSALAIELALINRNVEVKKDDSSRLPKSSITLKKFIEYYLKLENRSATSRSLDSYYIVGRKISKVYGNHKLCHLTPEHFILFFNKLKKECSNSIILKSYLLLKMIMEYAVSRDIISKNPMDTVKKPKSEQIKSDEYKAFTTEELCEIMSAAKNYPEIYPILLVLQNTGMRPGELRALKWDNVDFKNKTLSIKNAATYKTERESLDCKPVKTEYIGPTKSAYSIRTLSISDAVVNVLKEWREYINTNDKYKNAINSEFLFPSETGDFIKDDALRKKFRKFLKNAELSDKGYHLYRFRHTMCTNLVLKNVSIPVIQRIMGDNTTDVILKIYTSVNASDVTAATKVVQEYFNDINNN